MPAPPKYDWSLGPDRLLASNYPELEANWRHPIRGHQRAENFPTFVWDLALTALFRLYNGCHSGPIRFGASGILIVEELDHDASIAPFKSESVTKSSENGVKCKSRYRESTAKSISWAALWAAPSGTQCTAKRNFFVRFKSTAKSKFRKVSEGISSSSFQTLTQVLLYFGVGLTSK